MTGHPGTPAEISTSKTSNLHRTPTAFTERPLDDIGLRLVVQTRPDRPALYAQPTDATKAPMRHVFLGSRLRTPASSPPSLTTEQLPSACGWCHQPPQGTRTPELLVMLRALGRPTLAAGPPRTGRARFRASGSGKPCWRFGGLQCRAVAVVAAEVNETGVGRVRVALVPRDVDRLAGSR